MSEERDRVAEGVDSFVDIVRSGGLEAPPVEAEAPPVELKGHLAEGRQSMLVKNNY